MNGFLDLLSAAFISTQALKPLHVFGRVGLAFLALGLGLGVFFTVQWALGEPLRNPDLLTVPMFDDEILFAAPLGSPYAASAEIDLQAVRGEKFVALGDDFATYHDFMAAFDKAGFAPQIALRVGDIFSLMNLVSGGIGYALLPRRVADFSPKVQLIPLAGRYAIDQHIVLVMQRNRERDPNLLALSAECRLLGSLA